MQNDSVIYWKLIAFKLINPKDIIALTLINPQGDKSTEEKTKQLAPLRDPLLQHGSYASFQGL
jgi:hypothetical protein